MKRPHLRLRTLMIAVALAAGALLVYRWTLPDSPTVKTRRLRAAWEGYHERDWMRSERLALEGVTKIVRYPGPGGTSSEMLIFNHYVPRPRPTDPEQARAFDRDCVTVAAKCRIMARYFRQRRKDWERAVTRPWEPIPPDPTPPLRLEADSVRDASL